MARFVINRNLTRELQRSSPQFKADLLLQAEQAAQEAKSIAPVRTGRYRDSITASADAEGVSVRATDWKSGFIEFGTIHNPPFAPLRRGVQNAGLKFRPSR